MWVSGLRGAVALALALSFPSSNKSLIVTTTIVLILMSVLLFGTESSNNRISYLRSRLNSGNQTQSPFTLRRHSSQQK